MKKRGPHPDKEHEQLGVEKFIKLVHSRLVPGTAGRRGIWFSRRHEGSLFLDEEERLAYSEAISGLMNAYAPDEDLSRRSVETFLQDALFEALDLKKRSSDTFEHRLRGVLRRLRARLEAPSQTFTVWIPVTGLDSHELPAQFGGVRFVTFNRSQFRHWARELTTRSHRSMKTYLRQVRESDIWNATCAVVRVPARDFSAAQDLAGRRARQIADLVNVFSDLIPYNVGWLHLPGEPAGGRRVVPVRRDSDGDTTVSYEALDPLGPFSWEKLRAERPLFALFCRLSDLARLSKPNTCGALLLSASEWAGRATVDRRREEAFLLYAIALETLLLPGQEAGEMSYRLALRTAHVLGRTHATRTQLMREVKRLYTVRSKIVHAGSYEVTDEDLGSIRGIAKRVLLRLLRSASLHSLTQDELAEWLDRRILRR